MFTELYSIVFILYSSVLYGSIILVGVSKFKLKTQLKSHHTRPLSNTMTSLMEQVIRL